MPLYHIDPLDPAVVLCGRCGRPVGRLPHPASRPPLLGQLGSLTAEQAARAWPELAGAAAEHDTQCGPAEELVYVRMEDADTLPAVAPAPPSGRRDEPVYVRMEATSIAPAAGGALAGGAPYDTPPWQRPGLEVSDEAQFLARVAAVAVGLAAGGGIIAVVFRTVSEASLAGHPEAYVAWVMAGLLVAFGLSLAVHEAGHFLAGWAARLPLQAMLIGPAVFTRASGRWRLALDWRLSRNLKHTPVGGVYARWGGAGRWRWALFTLGGPLASLASGAAGAALFFAPLPLPVRCWAGLFAAYSVLVGAENLLPLRYGSLACDGLILWCIFVTRDAAGRARAAPCRQANDRQPRPARQESDGHSAPTADAQHDDWGHPRPWEQPGAVRRDVEPHRGHWLVALGTAALVLGALALCFGLTGLLGLPLAFLTVRLAGRDLRRMRAGRLDPAGRASAERALRLAWPAAALALLGLALWGWAFTAPRF